MAGQRCRRHRVCHVGSKVQHRCKNRLNLIESPKRTIPRREPQTVAARTEQDQGGDMSDDLSASVDNTADADRYVVVSIDSHVGPSVKDQLRPYCDAKHLDDFDRFVTEME